MRFILLVALFAVQPAWSAMNWALENSAQRQAYMNYIFEKHKTANTYEDWAHFPWHPDELSDHTTPANIGSLCVDLSGHPLKKRILFYNMAAGEKSCKDFHLQLKGELKTIQAQLLNRARKSSSKKPLSTEIRYIDPAGGGFYVVADLEEKELNLTFDDGPHPENTDEIYTALESHNALANFFLVGEKLERFPEVSQFGESVGHLMANHSWGHRNLSKVSVREMEKDIEKTFQTMDEHLDFPTPFFRFPYGAAKKKHRERLEELNIPEFFWKVDTLDWKYSDPEELYEYVMDQIHTAKKGIVLFHDIQPQTWTIMPAVLESLKHSEYKLIQFQAVEE